MATPPNDDDFDPNRDLFPVDPGLSAHFGDTSRYVTQPDQNRLDAAKPNIVEEFHPQKGPIGTITTTYNHNPYHGQSCTVTIRASEEGQGEPFREAAQKIFKAVRSTPDDDPRLPWDMKPPMQNTFDGSANAEGHVQRTPVSRENLANVTVKTLRVMEHEGMIDMEQFLRANKALKVGTDLVVAKELEMAVPGLGKKAALDVAGLVLANKAVAEAVVQKFQKEAATVITPDLMHSTPVDPNARRAMSTAIHTAVESALEDRSNLIAPVSIAIATMAGIRQKPVRDR